MKTEDSWRRKDLLTIEDLSLQELEIIFQTASSFKKTVTWVPLLSYSEVVISYCPPPVELHFHA